MKKEIQDLFERLWPVTRSITGNGVRQTFNILSEYLDLNITEVPSGKEVYDWKVPPEWNINDAYIITPEGKKIASLLENNLHILGYSIPVNKELHYDELVPHLYTLPEQPDLIPYLTSYYKENWGFCMTHNEFLTLPKEGKYKVVIDSDLNKEGSLTYADSILIGESKKEIILSTYVCHPSMANNELSGPIVAAFLYNELKKIKNRYFTYRFIFTPETIGTICYLNANEKYLKENTEAGLVISCAGDPGKFTYKKSRSEDSEINKMVSHILEHHAKDNYKLVEFIPIGSDERQYCSPGFNLPFGSLMRTMYGQYKEYHTSGDNKNFISFGALEETIQIYLKICQGFELNHKFKNQQPFCEPFLSKYGLYPDISSNNGQKEEWLWKILFILNFSDGQTPLLEIAQKLGVSILDLADSVFQLKEKNLLKN